MTSRVEMLLHRAEAASPELERELVALLAGVRLWLPEVRFEDEALLRFWGERLPDGEPPEAALARLHVRDLALVHACLQGERAALEHLDRQVLALLPRGLQRSGLTAALADEAVQRTRERLLLGGEGAAPKLASYLGQGPLIGWLRVVALRAAQNLRAERERASALSESDEARLEAEAASVDLELECMRARYREAFQEAIREALASLDAQERNLLRYAFVDGLPAERIAPLYRVHRTTLSRWLDKARERVVEAARSALQRRLRLTGSELQSALGLLRSDALVSITRALRAGAPSAETGVP